MPSTAELKIKIESLKYILTSKQLSTRFAKRSRASGIEKLRGMGADINDENADAYFAMMDRIKDNYGKELLYELMQYGILSRMVQRNLDWGAVQRNVERFARNREIDYRSKFRVFSYR